MKERRAHERVVERFDLLIGEVEEASILLDLTREEDDEELDRELDEKLRASAAGPS